MGEYNPQLHQMKKLWCWRCQLEVPMLNQEEASQARELYQQAFRERSKLGSLDARFSPLLDYYYQLTGWKETNPNAIIHHLIELYGPPCEQCNKPYRTPQASFCAACGHKKEHA